MYDVSQVQKVQPTQGSVHIDAPLTNISLAIMQAQDQFVARKVFPQIGVKNQSNSYFTFDESFFNRNDMGKRAPGTEASGGGYEVGTSTYSCDVFAYRHDIPKQVRENADAQINVDREGTTLCTYKALISEEVNWAASNFTNGIWNRDVQGVSGTPSGAQVKQWNDAASTPIEDIRAEMTTMQAATGIRPNTLTVNQQVLDALLDHPDVIDRIKYGQTPGAPALASKDYLKALFGLKDMHVMGAIVNSADEGATASNGFIGGKNALLAYVPDSPGLMTPSAGYTFNWTGMSGGAQGSFIKRYPMTHLDSDRIEIQTSYDHKVVSGKLAMLFYDVIA